MVDPPEQSRVKVKVEEKKVEKSSSTLPVSRLLITVKLSVNLQSVWHASTAVFDFYRPYRWRFYLMSARVLFAYTSYPSRVFRSEKFVKRHDCCTPSQVYVPPKSVNIADQTPFSDYGAMIVLGLTTTVAWCKTRVFFYFNILPNKHQSFTRTENEEKPINLKTNRW